MHATFRNCYQCYYSIFSSPVYQLNWSLPNSGSFMLPSAGVNNLIGSYKKIKCQVNSPNELCIYAEVASLTKLPVLVLYFIKNREMVNTQNTLSEINSQTLDSCSLIYDSTRDSPLIKSL